MSDVYKTIRYERHGDIGTMTVARPSKRNAQNPLRWEELAQLGAELLLDETLRCLRPQHRGGRARWARGCPTSTRGPGGQVGDRRGLVSRPEESFRLALEGQICCLESEDFKEARQAMVEGRSPQWRGR